MPSAPEPMALAGVHEAAVAALVRALPEPRGRRVLDIGAGQGAICRRLIVLGYQVLACDVVPSNFRLEGVECRPVGADGAIPFPAASIDAALAVEVIEHVESHRAFFAEAARVLRPGGWIVFTTPNILSLKSRWLFLLTGYGYSFGPLQPGVKDPVAQHLTPATLDRTRFLMAECRMELVSVATDKRQRSSLLWAWLAPIIRWSARRRHGADFAGAAENVRLQNSPEALLGRTLVVTGRKVA